MSNAPYQVEIKRLTTISERQSKMLAQAFSIGCMRFVGVNRTKLIRWAKAGK
jgi:hypothetical protein